MNTEHCPTCGKQLWREIQLPPEMGGTRSVRVMCDCERVAYEQEQAEHQQAQFDMEVSRLRRDGITDKTYFEHSFAKDNGSEPNAAKICRRYVEQWPEMRKNNIGMLLYGDVGTGKTFFACCVANALLERQVSVSVTNLPRALNIVQDSRDKQTVIDRLAAYELLVVDDLGVERSTDYALEQVFNLVDSRLRSGKPVIFTTNLSVDDLKDTTDIKYRRIYDRVLELCPLQVPFVGKSQRIANADVRRKMAREILKGAKA